MNRKKERYTEEFKKSIVNLYKLGKSATEIIREYGISSNTVYKWIRKYAEIRISETETISAEEVKALQKKLALLEEENIIL